MAASSRRRWGRRRSPITRSSSSTPTPASRGSGEVDSVFKRRGALLRHDLEKALVPAVIGEDPFRISCARREDGRGARRRRGGEGRDRNGALGHRRKGARHAALQSSRRQGPRSHPAQLFDPVRRAGRHGAPRAGARQVGTPDDQGEGRERRFGARHRGRAVDPRGDRTGRQASRRRQHGMADGEAGDRRHPRDGSMRISSSSSSRCPRTISTAWPKCGARSAFR